MLKTRYNLADCTPWSKDCSELKSLYKFYCPICMQYYKNILELDCCKNYICNHCINDYFIKQKNEEDFVIKCYFEQTPLNLVKDLEQSKFIKQYTNSF
jgi:hypothetical protein